MQRKFEGPKCPFFKNDRFSGLQVSFSKDQERISETSSVVFKESERILEVLDLFFLRKQKNLMESPR